MKAIWLTIVGVCVAGVSVAQAPSSAPLSALPVPETPTFRDTCLLGSGCLGMSKIPATACRVTSKNAIGKEACAVDGMKWVEKLTVTPSYIL